VESKRQIEAVERAMVAIRRRQARRALAKLAREHGSRAAYDVLDVVEAAEQAGEPASVTSVAAALDVDQPRASKLVAMAVESGLVRREADQADGRRALLVRTDEGRAASAEVHRFRQASFAAAMSDWTDHERAEFARLLGRFVDSLGKG
jgi:DNA-binding MarR family transcriptional regulator